MSFGEMVAGLPALIVSSNLNKALSIAALAVLGGVIGFARPAVEDRPAEITAAGDAFTAGSIGIIGILAYNTYNDFNVYACVATVAVAAFSGYIAYKMDCKNIERQKENNQNYPGYVHPYQAAIIGAGFGAVVTADICIGVQAVASYVRG